MVQGNSDKYLKRLDTGLRRYDGTGVRLTSHLLDQLHLRAVRGLDEGDVAAVIDLLQHHVRAIAAEKLATCSSDGGWASAAEISEGSPPLAGTTARTAWSYMT